MRKQNPRLGLLLLLCSPSGDDFHETLHCDRPAILPRDKWKGQQVHELRSQRPLQRSLVQVWPWCKLHLSFPWILYRPQILSRLRATEDFWSNLETPSGGISVLSTTSSSRRNTLLRSNYLNSTVRKSTISWMSLSTWFCWWLSGERLSISL